MKTKTLLFALLTILTLIVLLCLPSCKSAVQNDDADNHNHSFSLWATTIQPTCTGQGTQARSCSVCSFSEYVQIPAIGHKEIVDHAVAETCTTDGKTAGSHCGTCGIVITQQKTIKATGHSLVNDSAVKPTCTTEGKTEGAHCTKCNFVPIPQIKIPAYGHTPIIDKGFAPTCSTEGKTEGSHCAICNGILVPQTPIAAHGHSLVVDEAIAPTCTIDGKSEGQHCEVCGLVTIPQTVLKATGHQPVLDEGVAPSCTHSGKTNGAHCSVCNIVLLPQISVDALGHDLIVDAKVEPTCTASGKTEGLRCRTCGDVILPQETITPISHHLVVDAAISPSCTTEGKTAGQHCSICGLVVLPQESIKATGHNLIVDAVIFPTCVSEGRTQGSHCSTCGEIIVAQSSIPKSDHKYDEGVVVAVATCTKSGNKKFSCTFPSCNHSYIEPFQLSTYTSAEIYNQAIEYVGEIIAYNKGGTAVGVGTGFAYSSDGKIITNYHVIENAYSAKITICGRTYNVVSVLAYDKDIDLAVLKINTSGIAVAPICTSPLQVGQTIYAIGSSRGLTNTFTKGIVTCAERVLNNVTYVQHDASITHGNSGGPLINEYGEVVAVNTSCIADSQNLNFAVFLSELDNLVYGNPLTLAELYERNHDAHENVLSWLLKNYNYSDDQTVRFDYQATSAIFSLGYEEESNTVFIDAYWQLDDGSVLYMIIELSSDSSMHPYYATYEKNGKANEVSGYINANTFARDTILKYQSYDGAYWNERELMSLYSQAAVELLNWFEWLLINHQVGPCIADFGFTAIKFD